jgi:hypothetical protein
MVIPSSSKSSRKLSDHEKEGTPSLQNVDHYLPTNTVQYPRRTEYSYNDWLKCILLNVMNLESLKLVPK